MLIVVTALGSVSRSEEGLYEKLQLTWSGDGPYRRRCWSGGSSGATVVTTSFFNGSFEAFEFSDSNDVQARLTQRVASGLRWVEAQ